jgi:DNA-binding YbaB/EbfC family protein
MGSGFLKRKKEARAMQDQIAKMQSKMDEMECEGSAGNGLVTVLLLGNGTVKSIKIKPECIDKDDPEGLQDLVRAAFNDAKLKLDAMSNQGMSALQGLGGFPNIPGFSL